MACGDGKCSEFIVNAVLKRVEVGKISRRLQTRLAFAQFKVEHGLEDLSFDTIEPRMKEIQDANDHSSSSSSSGTLSSEEGEDNCYKNRTCLVESTGKSSAVFSDHHLMNINRGSLRHRKRQCKFILEKSNYHVSPWKRHCSSPLTSHTTPAQDRNQALSSPVMSCRRHHFTTDSGPSLPLFADSYRKSFMYKPFRVEIGKEDDELPPYPSDFRSSPPPRTPPSRQCNDNLDCHRYGSVERRGKPVGNNVHSIIYHPSTFPISEKTPARTGYSYSTPPPRTPTLPSSTISTTRGTCDIFSRDSDSHTPLQSFDFSDFVNMTPSPSRSSWSVTPRTVARSINVRK